MKTRILNPDYVVRSDKQPSDMIPQVNTFALFQINPTFYIFFMMLTEYKHCRLNGVSHRNEYN